MGLIWTKSSKYRRAPYQNEADLEAAILEVQGDLFGPGRIYLDVKKKIGSKGGVQNIPDGYLLDLSGAKPRLYVVENELASHDPLRHIAVQILEFSLSFEEEPRAVKTILFEALQHTPEAKTRCEQFFHFQPFLADLAEDIASTSNLDKSARKLLDVSEVDTLVVPSREEGFQ